MRHLITISVLPILTAACATAPDVAGSDYGVASRFVAMPRESIEVERGEFAPDPNQTITVDFSDKLPNPGFNPVEGLEQMPFGGSMFGPWDPGASGPGVKIRGGRAIDLVGMDLHTLAHCVALGTGLQIIVEGNVNVRVSTSLHIPEEGVTKSVAKDFLHSICKMNKLDYVEDGNVIIIKKRPVEELSNVVPGKTPGRFDVHFEDHPLATAILETANATRVQVFVPAKLIDRDDSRDARAQIDGNPITLKVSDATPEEILGELARLGDMEIEVVPLGDSDPSKGIAYRFSYKQ